MSSPDQGFLQSVVLLLQLLELSAGGCSLHSRVTDLLLDDLQVYGQLLHLLLQSLRLHLQTLTLQGEEGGGREGGEGVGEEEREGGSGMEVRERREEGGITGDMTHEHLVCLGQLTREFKPSSTNGSLTHCIPSLRLHKHLISLTTFMAMSLLTSPDLQQL